MVRAMKRDAHAPSISRDVHDTSLAVELVDHVGSIVRRQAASKEKTIANLLNSLEMLRTRGENENCIGRIDRMNTVDE